MQNNNGFNTNIGYIPACSATGFLLNTNISLYAERMKQFLEENQENYIYFDNNKSLKTKKINAYKLLSREEILDKNIFSKILKRHDGDESEISEEMILCYCEEIYLEKFENIQ